jgi:anti-sigma regulatory factor (Ser/Thr protein kinase)
VNDEITLTMPRDRAFFSVAHLVLGGIGVRLNITIETLEDLQLALDAMLERDHEPGDVTIAVRVAENSIETEIGPFGDGVRRELEREGKEEVGLRRILETLVDGVDVRRGDGGDWVTLKKAVRVEGQ